MPLDRLLEQVEESRCIFCDADDLAPKHPDALRCRRCGLSFKKVETTLARERPEA